ncbi:hypothetical protein ACFS1K_17415, partial [Arenibacter antarcticus]
IQGNDGPAGPQGLAGADGNDGADGAQGPTGADGAQGPAGADGNDGADGAQGIQGNDGPTGPSGADGNDGADGVQGPQGIQGNDGPAGPQGLAGIDGADGAQGPQGLQGIQGNDGPAGPQGLAGADGADGAQGPQGIQGNDGPAGPQGLAGADGADGAQGPQGIQGNDGPIGPTGADGAQGPQGPTGAVGPAGDPATDDQTLSTNGDPGDISISGGNTISLNVNDADFDPTNELQTLSQTGTDVTLSNGGGSISVADNDNDPTNEIQDASQVSYTNTTSGLAATNTQAAIDELAATSTDDQYDDEVLLRVPIDVDDAGKTVVTNETTIQEVIQAIAPITSKAARIFYPPSIAVDASSTGTGRKIDLHDQYITQFGSPMVSSNLAPTAIPTYANTELYYYVTHYDNSVFDNVSVDEFGEMTYDVIATPTDYNSLINVVFVVK